MVQMMLEKSSSPPELIFNSDMWLKSNRYNNILERDRLSIISVRCYENLINKWKIEDFMLHNKKFKPLFYCLDESEFESKYLSFNDGLVWLVTLSMYQFDDDLCLIRDFLYVPI